MLEISGSESLARAMSHETLQMGKTFGWDQIAQDLLRDLAATQHPCGFTEEPRAESA